MVDKSEKFAIKREIKINRENPNYYEIQCGLLPNEKIFVSGYDNFGNVEKINLIN